MYMKTSDGKSLRLITASYLPRLSPALRVEEDSKGKQNQRPLSCPQSPVDYLVLFREG